MLIEWELLLLVRRGRERRRGGRGRVAPVGRGIGIWRSCISWGVVVIGCGFSRAEAPPVER